MRLELDLKLRPVKASLKVGGRKEKHERKKYSSRFQIYDDDFSRERETDIEIM